MCDDDSFNVATVPRHAVFGGQAGGGDGDDESTLGDRFFDFLPLQAKTIPKADSDHYMSSHNRCKLVSPDIKHEYEQITKTAITATAAIKHDDKNMAVETTDSSAENIQDDVPFELNRLAMFRPPSRARLSGRRSNTIPQEENATHLPTSAMEPNCGPNNHSDRKTASYTCKVSSNGSNQPSKTLRCNTSRLLQPTQMRQRSLDRDRNRIQSIEMRQRTGSVTCQPVTKVRATSAEPRTQRTAMSFMGTRDASVRKTTDTTVRIQLNGPLRVRSASTNAAATKNISTRAENTLTTNQITKAQCRNGSKTAVNAEGVVSKTGATRYTGPETRSRARMKESDENLEMGKSGTVVSTSKKSMFVKSVSARPLSQLNTNVSRNASGNSTAPVPHANIAEKGHISRSRTRGAHEPIRVRNTQGRVQAADGLPPIESESRFRQSLTRRPKGGDSLDRDVTNATGKENGGEIWTVVTKKPEPLLEFAPCLRSRVAAKRIQSTSKTDLTKFQTPKTMQSRQSVHRTSRRLTGPEREALFRRLSIPKTVVTDQKCTK